MKEINRDRLFLASCVALVVTAMTFAIRAGILTELGAQFKLTDTQLGWVNSMAFLGFPVAMIIGGLLYNEVGAKKMVWAAFFSHLLGLVLTITAGGFWGLLVSTFFIGFANGCVEAACNPLIADMYHDNKTTMLNRFHVWFPGGIVIGSLVAQVMGGSLEMGWQAQIGIMVIPTLVYAYLIFGQTFPETEHIESSTAKNIKGLANPLFLFIAACMTLTASTEFGTTQWVERILGNAGAQPLIILALVTGLMALGRYFAGSISTPPQSYRGFVGFGHHFRFGDFYAQSGYRPYGVCSCRSVCHRHLLLLAHHDWFYQRIPAQNWCVGDVPRWWCGHVRHVHLEPHHRWLD